MKIQPYLKDETVVAEARHIGHAPYGSLGDSCIDHNPTSHVIVLLGGSREQRDALRQRLPADFMATILDGIAILDDEEFPARSPGPPYSYVFKTEEGIGILSTDQRLEDATGT
jgi:hypothetical protein